MSAWALRFGFFLRCASDAPWMHFADHQMFSMVPMRDWRSTLVRHNAWQPAKELRRGRIAKKTPWTSMLKVSLSNKSATSLILEPSSVRIELMELLTMNFYLGFRRRRVHSTNSAVYGTVVISVLQQKFMVMWWGCHKREYPTIFWIGSLKS